MGEITRREALDESKTVYMAYRNFAERTREEYLNDLVRRGQRPRRESTAGLPLSARVKIPHGAEQSTGYTWLWTHRNGPQM